MLPPTARACLGRTPDYPRRSLDPTRPASVYVAGVDRLTVLGQLAAFVWRERAWWMLPTLLALLAVAGLAVLSATSPLAPFIYPLF
jgi:hypothetical protein